MRITQREEKIIKEKEGTSQPIQVYAFHEILFVVSAIIFNVSVSGVYLASKFDNEVLLQTFGALVVVLCIPFTVSLIGYGKRNAEKKILLSLVIILLYLALEIVFDYVLRIPFRDIFVLHAIYIIVFYAAAFSMIGVSFGINKKMGFSVLLTFLMVIGCLMYMYLG